LSGSPHFLRTSRHSVSRRSLGLTEPYLKPTAQAQGRHQPPRLAACCAGSRRVVASPVPFHRVLLGQPIGPPGASRHYPGPLWAALCSWRAFKSAAATLGLPSRPVFALGGLPLVKRTTLMKAWWGNNIPCVTLDLYTYLIRCLRRPLHCGNMRWIGKIKVAPAASSCHLPRIR